MNKTNNCLLLLIAVVLFSKGASAQVKIGSNPTTIGNSSLLELESTNKALVIPRVTNTSAITNPVNGMVVYDLSSTCAKSYENGAWSDCLSGGGPSAISANCDPTTNGFQGTYVPGGTVTLFGATTFKVTLVNNSLFEGSITPSTSDVTLSGASGLTIASVSPSTTTTIPGGGSLTITYTLGGTVPTTGVVTATFVKAGLTCSNTLDVSVTPTLSKTILTTCTQTATGTGLSNWQSNQPGRATIDASTGLLTGVSTGNTYIHALKTGTNYRVAKLYTVAAKVVTVNSTGSGTLTIPGTDIVSFEAEAYGAGGGGGGGCGSACVPNYIGGSGGSGAYTKKLYTVSSGNSSYSYVVGTGGVGGFSTNNGSSGGNTTLTYASNTITAGGGGGGIANNPGAAAGTATGGDVNTNGNSGLTGAMPPCGTSGRGGLIAAGPAGGAGGTSSTGNGGNGTQPGGSGAGGGINSSCNQSTGGTGGNGRIVVTYTCP